MKSQLYDYLISQSGTLSVQQIVMSFTAATIIGLVIFISYRFSHASSVYSAKFNVTLVMLTLVTTLAVSIIGNNIALSLGMVGALSIVRFRTAVKDSRDTAYIFWCIAAGICCGIEDYEVAAIGSAFIFVLMLIMGNVRNNDRFLIIVRGKDGSSEIKGIFNTYFGSKATFRVDNSDKNGVEFIYEVSQRTLKKSEKKKKKDIKTALLELENVDAVSIVCQNDEITR